MRPGTVRSSALTSEPWCELSGTPEVLTVIGGSSPFVLGLVEAISADPPWHRGTLRLHGRDHDALRVVAGAAAALLASSEWRVEHGPDLRAMLDGADVVLHQNRYGGLAARRDDELLTSTLGVPPDETLGPAGLLTALRTAHDQRKYAEELRRTAPRSALLTLTNPLGVSTACLAAAGLAVLGLCEVPETTRRTIATAVGVAVDDLSGDYTGLNHRGFWHRLRTRDGDLGGRVAEALDRAPDRLPWTDASEVRRLQAVPDKYSVLRRGRGVMQPGRAQELDELRRRILAEAAATPMTLPPSLAVRGMPWYDLVVLPALRALAGTPHRLVVTCGAPGEAAQERQVVLDGCSVSYVAQEDPPLPVEELCHRYLEHERLVIAAVAEPTRARLAAALAADPTVPATIVGPASRAVMSRFERWIAA
jgi:6-phospho-beta-glucosidase